MTGADPGCCKEDGIWCRFCSLGTGKSGKDPLCDAAASYGRSLLLPVVSATFYMQNTAYKGTIR